MLYDITLRIKYAYNALVAGGRHILYLTPADLPGQRPITSLLDVTPRPDERSARTDFFGNTLIEAAFTASHSEIEFRLRSRVERSAVHVDAGVSTLLADLPKEIAALRSLSPESPHHFIADSPRVRTGSQFKTFARDEIGHRTLTTLKAVENIGKAVHRDLKFDPGSTKVDTPPEDAFAQRHGVCQDFSHIMIACLRSVGIPAGYVSGFLRTLPPPGQQRLDGADAMHAWVRAWCGSKLGWVEYDPTNGICVSDQHVVVAYGRDYGDVAPIRGIVRTAGGQSSSQAVDVVPLN